MGKCLYCNFNIVWNLYWQMLCLFFANVCLNYYYYIMPLCYVAGTRHMNIEADVIAFDCMADVIAMQL